MINEIKNNPELIPHLYSRIEDEGIECTIDSTLTTSDYIAIKVDDYYASLHKRRPPKSVDFIVLVDGQCNSFALYVLELKNVNGPNRLIISDIQEKFDTTIYDFLSEKFKSIFLHDRYKYKLIKLYLVSDAYRNCGRFSSHQEYLEYNERRSSAFRKDSLKVERHLGQKLYKFKGKLLKIEYDTPPNPIITKPA